jgi:ribosomal protein S18 acetylase RimI-like enzyme
MIVAEVIMRSDVRIRPATGSDQAFVHNVTDRLIAFGPPSWRTPEEIVEAERRTLNAFFIDPPRDTALLIAENDTRLGFIYLETQIDYFTGERHGHVGIIAVDDAAEGKGVGRALLDTAASWARARGFRRLTLNVFAGNERARRVYERAGFQPETLRYVRAV